MLDGVVVLVVERTTGSDAKYATVAVMHVHDGCSKSLDYVWYRLGDMESFNRAMLEAYGVAEDVGLVVMGMAAGVSAGAYDWSGVQWVQRAG